MNEQLRQLPSVQSLLDWVDEQKLEPSIPYAWKKAEAQKAAAWGRERILAGDDAVSAAAIRRELESALRRLKRQELQPVINATGVLIHTNLGRAPLSRQLLADAAGSLSGYCALEYDVETGARGRRAPAVEALIASAAHTEAALVVNNNAAAVLLVLSALAVRKEVIVSRGELVEIGGGFRVPDVIRQSGCRLIEVGTTNKTRVEDYAAAVTDDTAVLLKIHPSNFHMTGFVENPERQALYRLALERGLWFVEDLGSGAFWPPPDSGKPEPLVKDAARFSHAVTFSGDKLLGGPQAGIIAGASECLQRCRTHPLFRALRSDKLSLFLLQEVFRRLLQGEFQELPLYAMAHADPDTLRQRAAGYLAHLGQGFDGRVTAGQSTMGGGSLPGETIPTWVLALHSRELSAERLAAYFRSCSPPIITRVVDDEVLLDPRTVFVQEDEMIHHTLKAGVSRC